MYTRKRPVTVEKTYYSDGKGYLDKHVTTTWE